MISAVLDRSTPPVDDATRREFLIGGALLAALIAGCSSQPDGTLEPSGSSDGRFPVTINHKHGTTVIPDESGRVVCVGLTDQDALLALGVTPVGTVEFYGEYPGAIWPWAQDRVQGRIPEVVSSYESLNFEAVAALEPDLIIGVYAGLTRDEYDRLARIAPTVAQPAEFQDYGVLWQDQTRIVARALGRPQRAEELIADVQNRFVATRARHPEFAGAAAVLAQGGSWPRPRRPSARYGTRIPASSARRSRTPTRTNPARS